MQFKLTKQYAKDDENALAEFQYLDDAMKFLVYKSDLDEKQSIVLIYRIFDQNKLIKELNKEKIKYPLQKARYADKDQHLPEPFAQPFKVIKQITNDNAQLLAQFNDIEDAKIFINAKFASPQDSKDNITYLIFDMGKIILKIDRNNFDSQSSQKESSQGKEKVLSFRPTPFPHELRLGPPKWVVDEDNDGESSNK